MLELSNFVANVKHVANKNYDNDIDHLVNLTTRCTLTKVSRTGGFLLFNTVAI